MLAIKWDQSFGMNLILGHFTLRLMPFSHCGKHEAQDSIAPKNKSTCKGLES